MKRIIGILFLLTLVSLIFINSCKTPNSYYVINQDKCVYCQKCVTVCGFHAITMITSETDRDTLVIDPNKCVGCGECYIVCTDTGFNAITEVPFDLK